MSQVHQTLKLAQLTQPANPACAQARPCARTRPYRGLAARPYRRPGGRVTGLQLSYRGRRAVVSQRHARSPACCAASQQSAPPTPCRDTTVCLGTQAALPPAPAYHNTPRCIAMQSLASSPYWSQYNAVYCETTPSFQLLSRNTLSVL